VNNHNLNLTNKLILHQTTNFDPISKQQISLPKLQPKSYKMEYQSEISNVDIAANVLAHRALNNIKGKQFFDSAEFFMKKSANPMNRINPQSTTEQYNLPHYQ
jgi:hypothetical protein